MEYTLKIANLSCMLDVFLFKFGKWPLLVQQLLYWAPSGLVFQRSMVARHFAVFLIIYHRKNIHALIF